MLAIARELFIEVYEKYQPLMTDSADSLFVKNPGKVLRMYEQICKKYETEEVHVSHMVQQAMIMAGQGHPLAQPDIEKKGIGSLAQSR